MKYTIKSEIFKHDFPFNKWFDFDTSKKYRISELVEELGIERNKVGLVLVNNYVRNRSYMLQDKDSIRIIGRIYSEYL